MSILYYIVNHTKKIYYDTYHKHVECIAEDEKLMLDFTKRLSGKWRGDSIEIVMEWFIEENCKEYKPIEWN